MDGNPADDSGEEAKIGRFSRRSVIRLGTLAGVGAAGGVGALAFSTGGARAEVSGASLIAADASVSSDDGTINDVTLQDETPDDDAGIDFNWEGFDQNTVTVTFSIRAGLTGSAADEEPVQPQELISGSTEVTGTNGSVSLDWADVFGVNSVSLLERTDITAADFESATDSQDRVREMEVILIADATHDGTDVEVSAESTATAELTATNIDGTASTGGNVDISMTADPSKTTTPTDTPQ